MKICAYRIIEHRDVRELERMVNDAAEQGFIPVGGMVVLPELAENDRVATTFFQPVARMAISEIVRSALRRK